MCVRACVCVCVWSGGRRKGVWLSWRNSSTDPSISHLKKTHGIQLPVFFPHWLITAIALMMGPTRSAGFYILNSVHQLSQAFVHHSIMEDCVSKWRRLSPGLKVQNTSLRVSLRPELQLWCCQVPQPNSTKSQDYILLQVNTPQDKVTFCYSKFVLVCLCAFFSYYCICLHHCVYVCLCVCAWEPSTGLIWQRLIQQLCFCWWAHCSDPSWPLLS